VRSNQPTRRQILRPEASGHSEWRLGFEGRSQKSKVKSQKLAFGFDLKYF
jgi:hypothetical protein